MDGRAVGLITRGRHCKPLRFAKIRSLNQAVGEPEATEAEEGFGHDSDQSLAFFFAGQKGLFKVDASSCEKRL